MKNKTTGSLPLVHDLSVVKSTPYKQMSQSELNAELTTGIKSLKTGKVYSKVMIDQELAKVFGI